MLRLEWAHAVQQETALRVLIPEVIGQCVPGEGKKES